MVVRSGFGLRVAVCLGVAVYPCLAVDSPCCSSSPYCSGSLWCSFPFPVTVVEESIAVMAEFSCGYGGIDCSMAKSVAVTTESSAVSGSR